MGIAFFNKPGYKKFAPPSRYYDEEKTELERRRARWRKLAEKEDEKGDNKASYVYDSEELRAELRLRWPNYRQSNSWFNRRYSHWKRIIVLVVIMILLIMAMYYIGLKYAV